jgi:glycosyltransferase involved in cell wall biosynthesis
MAALPSRILLLNWRDPQNPKAGGAETLTMNWAEAWQHSGSTVTLFTNRFPGCEPESAINSIRVVRRGHPLTQWLHAYLFDRKEGPFDLVVEEINTLPFFSSIWARGRSVLLMHQLAREVWFYETALPLAIMGYLAEPLYLRTYRKQPALVLSQSTGADLARIGFRPDHVFTVPGACSPVAVSDVAKAKDITFLYVGRLAPSKRVDHIIRAFAQVSRALAEDGVSPQLKIVGSGSNVYEHRLRQLAARQGLSHSVEFCGWIDKWWLDERLVRSHVLLLASVREGWGLVVTEANSVGIPAVGYPVPGLRDSIVNGVTGILTQSQTPGALALEMLRVARSPELLQHLATAGSKDAAQRTWSASRSEAVRQLARAVGQLARYRDK